MNPTYLRLDTAARASLRSQALRVSSVVVSFAACLLLAVACSSSEEAAPSRVVTPAPVPTVPDANAPETSLLEDGGSCTTPEGCFSCEPTALTEFLNSCTDGQCSPFDNAGRLPLHEPGKPLPAIP